MDLILETIPGISFANQRGSRTTTSSTAATTSTPPRSIPPVVARQSQRLSTNDGYSFFVAPIPAAPVPYIVTTEQEASEQVDELMAVLKVCGKLFITVGVQVNTSALQSKCPRTSFEAVEVTNVYTANSQLSYKHPCTGRVPTVNAN